MHNKNKSRVFVTGANGFVGANIVRQLIKEQQEVHILNHSKKLSWRLADIQQYINTHQGDLLDFNSLKKALQLSQPDYIFHLAAYGAYHYQNEFEQILQTNIIGTSNLLEASKDISYKYFINTGSSSEYGYKKKPMKEDDFCEPISYYAVTKLAQTNICKVFAQINNKPIITFRLFSVFGPYEEPGRFIPAIMKALIRKGTIQLTPGNQRRDFIYIDDVVSVYLQIMKSKEKIYGDIFNIGTGEEYSNDEIVKDLFKLTKKKTIIDKGAYPKRSWDTTHWVADISKAKRVLKWKPNVTLDNAIQSTYSWFEKNLQFYN